LDKKSQSTDANSFSDDSSNESNANFSAEGFGAMQDLRFLGSADKQSGSEFKSSVVPITRSDGSVIPPSESRIWK